jgi:signal transduction histidine kinase
MLKQILNIINEKIADDNLREQYQQETKDIGLQMVKVTCFIGIFFYPLFGILDLFVFPKKYLIIWGLRGFFVLLTIIIYLMVNTKFVRNNPQEIGTLIMIASGIVIASMCHITGGPASIYYAGINLTVLVMIFILFLSVKQVTFSCLIIYAYYMYPTIINSSSNFNQSIVISNNFFLITTMLLSIAGTYYKNRVRLTELSGRINVEKANKKLAEANKNKDIFLSNVSHELRTPLTLALTPLESMMQGELGQFKKEENQTLERMHENLHALLRQINDLLDLTRLQEGRMILKYKDDDISQLIEGIVNRVKPTAEKKEISISYTHEGDISDLFFDHSKMEKVIINLVSNALKFTKRGGRIDVSSRSEGGKVIIDVSDTGVGIEEDKLDSVFERFVQADGSYSREYGGSGIGLALVKDIVELHGGGVSVQSQFGKGAVFTVELPKGSSHINTEDIVKGEDESQGELESLKYSKLIKSVDTMTDVHKDISVIEEKYNGVSNATQKVLIVEDNPDMYSLLADVLHNDFKIYIAPNGEEGLNKIRELRPDIVTTDIMMPKKDGISMLKDIRADEEIKNTPVIILSSKAEVSSKIEGLEKGADDFIPKPFNPRELQARIRSLIMQRKIQSVITEKESLEKQIAALSRLTAAIAHEINNPIGNIRHSSSVLERIDKEYSKQHGSPVNDDKGIEKFLSSISDLIKLISIDSQRAVEIVDNFKLLSKNTRMHKVKERFNLKKRLNEDLLSIESKIKKLNHQVTLNCPDIEVESYPGVFSQIFSNLVSNAMIHGFDQGISGKINIDVLTTDQGLKLVFADNGKGIPTSDLDKIFEPFYTTNQGQGNTGLGLNIVYNLITQKLGGEISCESKPNEGTKLIISMPVGTV